MRRLWTRACLTCAMAVVIGAGVASAQRAVAEIPFKFLVGGKAMSAGSYQIEQSAAGPVVVTGKGADAMVTMPVLAYLGRHDTDAEIELIFDKLDGEMHLSEVWFPRKDGVLLLGTKERHDHQVLKGAKK
jgi:hypothetical protein